MPGSQCRGWGGRWIGVEENRVNSNSRKGHKGKVFLQNVRLQEVKEPSSFTTPPFSFTSKFPGPNGIETRTISTMEVVQWAEETLAAKGLEETIATFPYRGSCPDLYRVMDKCGYDSSMGAGVFHIKSRGHFADLEGINSHDPAGDKTEGAHRTITNVPFDIISPEENIRVPGIGGNTEIQLQNVVVDEVSISRKNHYIFCTSEPFSKHCFEEFGRHCFRIKHFPIFIASINIALKTEEKKRKMTGEASFVQTGHVDYLPQKIYRSKSMRDPKRNFDPVWFKPKKCKREQEWRMTWQMPESINKRCVEVTSENARRLLEPVRC